MSTPHAVALLRLVERCDGKLVLIGDPHQIGAVGPGGIYGHLTRLLETIELTEIRRQREEVDRDIVRLAHEGRGSDALDVLAANERLRIAESHDEALDALALDWHRSFAAGEDAVMVARRNGDVERLNDAAREFRRERGELGEGLPVADREFNVGDRVMTRVNTPEVSNRERWEVSASIAATAASRSVVSEARAVARSSNASTCVARPQRAIPRSSTPTRSPPTPPRARPSRGPSCSLTLASAARTSSSRSRAPAVRRLPTVSPPPSSPDVDLGPGKREIVDPLHDLRHGAERVASEFAATEVDARKQVEALAPVDLARRRAELERALAETGEPSPAAERLAALDRRISTAKDRLEGLAAERASAADRGERERAARLERQGSSQLRRLEGERGELAGQAAAEPVPAARAAETRFELRLVEERLLQLRRMQVAAERLSPTRPTLDALGPYPRDPALARAWDDGADLSTGSGCATASARLTAIRWSDVWKCRPTP